MEMLRLVGYSGVYSGLLKDSLHQLVSAPARPKLNVDPDPVSRSSHHSPRMLIIFCSDVFGAGGI